MQAFSDPAFATNKSEPIHRWVPWIAGFSSRFAADALERQLERPGTVLDPFCGVGTALVEALWRGHRALGFEINPWAALAAHTKTSARLIDPDHLAAETGRFLAFYQARTSTRQAPKSGTPPGFRTRAPFYSRPVLRKVLVVNDFLEELRSAGSPLLDVFRLAFGATLVRYSNYSYEPSLGRRVSAGRDEVRDFAVGEAIVEKLEEIIEDVRWLRGSPRGPTAVAEVRNASCFQRSQQPAPGSVDLILTSPPYLNNYHYNRNTRPQLYWLGFVTRPADLKPLADGNFGKYWQTVRECERIDLGFQLPDSDLADRIASLRSSNRERGIYGGNGWANYACCYFNDCHRFALSMRRVLRRGGTALVVLGNSVLQGVEIPTDRYLAEIARSVGLELVAIHLPRAARVGTSIIQSEVRVAKARDARLYEAVVELRRA